MLLIMFLYVLFFLKLKNIYLPKYIKIEECFLSVKKKKKRYGIHVGQRPFSCFEIEMCFECCSDY